MVVSCIQEAALALLILPSEFGRIVHLLIPLQVYSQADDYHKQKMKEILSWDQTWCPNRSHLPIDP
jgi:hypothetical protein